VVLGAEGLTMVIIIVMEKEVKMGFLKMFKSRTIDFNIIATSVVAILTNFGVDVPIEVVTGVFGIGNFVLRFLTKNAVGDK